MPHLSVLGRFRLVAFDMVMGLIFRKAAHGGTYSGGKEEKGENKNNILIPGIDLRCEVRTLDRDRRIDRLFC